MTVLLASEEVPHLSQDQPPKTLMEMEQVQTTGINEFSCRYKCGDCRKHGQSLDRRIFNKRSMANGAKRYAHLAVRQYVFIPRHVNGPDNDHACPVDVEVRKQEVNAPLMVAVDNAP